MFSSLVGLCGIISVIEDLIANGDLKIPAGKLSLSLAEERKKIIQLAGQLTHHQTRVSELAASILAAAQSNPKLTDDIKATVAGLRNALLGLDHGRSGGDYKPVPQPSSRPRIPPGIPELPHEVDLFSERVRNEFLASTSRLLKGIPASLVGDALQQEKERISATNAGMFLSALSRILENVPPEMFTKK